MIRLYNEIELKCSDTPKNLIFCGLYYHGLINDIIGNHSVYIEAVISAKNDKISAIEIPELRQDGIYDVYTIFNGIKYDLKLFYWKIKTKQNIILHKGLAVLNTDKESIKVARQKLKSKKIYL